MDGSVTALLAVIYLFGVLGCAFVGIGIWSTALGKHGKNNAARLVRRAPFWPLDLARLIFRIINHKEHQK